MEFDEKFIEEIGDMVFKGASFSYRDTHLSENMVAKYKTGMVIMEKGFLDSSSKGEGMSYNSNLRYLVISSQNKTMPSMFQDFGLCMISSGSYFKVIDIINKESKTQVTLLHIPREAVDLFSKYTTNYEEFIIQQSRENFLAKITLNPVPELEDEEWIERTKPPLGMDDEGNFFELHNV